MLTGRMIPAEEAERYGIVNFVWPAEELEARTVELAEQIASKPAFAAERIKRATRSGLPLAEGLRNEQKLFAECFNSPDGKEGVAAFLEKRKPRFNR
jgi:enoyl-CoA hydratase